MEGGGAPTRTYISTCGYNGGCCGFGATFQPSPPGPATFVPSLPPAAFPHRFTIPAGASRNKRARNSRRCVVAIFFPSCLSWTSKIYLSCHAQKHSPPCLRTLLNWSLAAWRCPVCLSVCGINLATPPPRYKNFHTSTPRRHPTPSRNGESGEGI